MVLFGSAFIAVWFASLFLFQAPGPGVHLLLVIPIVAFLARAWKDLR